MLLSNLPLPSREAALPLALLVLWAALLFGGFVFGSSSLDRTRRMPTWTRLGSSLAGDLVWLTYGPAQALIVTSVVAASMVAAPHILSTLATLPR